MTWSKTHLSWLRRIQPDLQTEDRKSVEIWEFTPENDDALMTAWATHFRNHYCEDTQIDRLIRGTGLSKAEYLRERKFPDNRLAPGPSIRAGDFAEILTADYLEYVLNFWVPRTRYANKIIRNESVKGCDTIGFVFTSPGTVNPNDTIAIFESKAKFSGDRPSTRLQDAIEGSAKDTIRKAESLNAMKQRYLDVGEHGNADKVERFQDEADRPYRSLYGAVAHMDSLVFDQATIEQSTGSGHPFGSDLKLVVIKGDNMMKMVHNLFRRAADEA